MAIILADDFQQLATASSRSSYEGLPANASDADISMHLPIINALGYDYPASLSGVFDNQTRPTVYYETTKKALAICFYAGRTQDFPGATGLRRNIKYTGDTLYFGFSVSFSSEFTASGDFLDFSGFHKVGIDTSGYLTLDGDATDVKAYYSPSPLRLYLDVVISRTTIELWSNNVLLKSKSRTALPISSFFFTFEKMSGTAGCWLHSLIIADNTAGFGQRVGRRVVKTETITAAPVVGSTIQSLNSSPAVNVIRKYASGPLIETDTAMLGSLVYPKGYVTNEFNATRLATRVPHAALVNIQAKRLSPSGDGLGVRPYLTIAAKKVYGKTTVPSSTWKAYTVEIPATENLNVENIVFGYEHEYAASSNRLWLDDHAQVEVYGEKAYSNLPDGYVGASQLTTRSFATQTTAYDAYVFDYAKSNLTQTKTNIDNLTYQQDQP